MRKMLTGQQEDIYGSSAAYRMESELHIARPIVEHIPTDCLVRVLVNLDIDMLVHSSDDSGHLGIQLLFGSGIGQCHRAELGSRIEGLRDLGDGVRSYIKLYDCEVTH